jgi:GTP cyclohydrolase I
MMLEDVQNRGDDRQLAIEEVGITGLRYPIAVWDRERGKQETIAEVRMSVGLPAHLKGTHMSRFVEVLQTEFGELTQRTIPIVLAELQRRLDAQGARMRVTFPYFLPRVAPVSGATALMDYQCSFTASAQGVSTRFALAVRVPVTSVCPCSKAISDYGAHNQRGFITIEVTPCKDANGDFALVWIEELIEVAEASASSPVYPLLKRSDERHVTMAAYENPVFVEDMVRDVATRLRDDSRIAQFSVEAINDESIHNHGAYARLTWPTIELSALGPV